MLVVPYLRENTQKAIQGLQKRNLQNAAALIKEVLDTDDQRKKTQSNLDAILAESNAISKEIGAMMKAGQKDKAETLKQKTASLKEQSKQHEETLGVIESQLQKLLYSIPNVPHVSVPAGKSCPQGLVQGRHQPVFVCC